MSETVRHTIVLTDADPLRRTRLAEIFEKWYGKQFPVVTAADAKDTKRMLQGLAADETQVVLVAAVADQPKVPDTLELSEPVGGGAGRLWLAPGEGEAESLQDGTVRLPFAPDRLADLDIRTIDKVICRWWDQAPEGDRGSLYRVAIKAHFRSARAFEIRVFLAGSGLIFCWDEVDTKDIRVRVDNGEWLTDPSLAELAVACKLVDKPSTYSFDVVVVGGGPAGLSAAVYAGTEGLTTLVIENNVPGGQVSASFEIANYLGFPDGISGYELARRALAQARKYKVVWQPANEAIKLNLGDANKPHEVVVGSRTYKTEDVTYKAGAVVIASGMKWNKLSAEGVDKVTGAGVYYIALPADAPMTKDDEVVVVGGGNSAGQAALHLAEYAKHVTMIVRGEIKVKMANYLVNRIKEKGEKISVWENSVVTKCVANNNNELESVIVDKPGKKGKKLKTRWMYCLIGTSPNSDWTRSDKILLSAQGAVLTGHNIPGNIKRSSTESSVPGVYAIGDVQHGTRPRVGSAMGNGAVIIAELFDYITKHPKLFPSFKPSD